MNTTVEEGVLTKTNPAELPTAKSGAGPNPVTEAAKPATPDRDEPLAPLFVPDAAKDFGARWDSVQIGFVDDPRQAVRKAAVARPFGHPTDLRDTASKLADWCDGFLRVLKDTPAPVYTPQQAERPRYDRP